LKTEHNDSTFEYNYLRLCLNHEYLKAMLQKYYLKITSENCIHFCVCWYKFD